MTSVTYLKNQITIHIKSLEGNYQFFPPPSDAKYIYSGTVISLNRIFDKWGNMNNSKTLIIAISISQKISTDWPRLQGWMFARLNKGLPSICEVLRFFLHWVRSWTVSVDRTLITFKSHIKTQKNIYPIGKKLKNFKSK